MRPIQRLLLLALLEASRLEEQGDMTGAWGWYRSALRTIHHVGQYGTFYRRVLAQTWHKRLMDRLNAWSANPRTTPSLLRQAVDDVVSCEAIVPSESYTLKDQYLSINESPYGPDALVRHMPPSWLVSLGSSGAARFLGPFLTPEQVRSISAGWRVWRREPERSWRVMRLLMANRIAFYDLPPEERPRPDPNVLTCDLYSLGPEARPEARVLSPDALDRWLESTQDPQRLISYVNLRGIQIKEVANQYALVMLLGTELYRRDHRADPESPEALVGPYLKRLPMDFPEE
jgi:hypothetical protein